MTTLKPKVRGFHRALGVYLRQNHGVGRSGKLTPRQRRRLRKHYPDEMRQRCAELGTLLAAKGWA